MHLEIEAKLRVADHGPLRERLSALNATCVGKVRETNAYFELADPDAALRVRSEIDENGLTRVRVTFKGPRQDGPFKQRQEVEYVASDADAAMLVFTLAGHPPSLVFEKDRETYLLDGCEVVLDTLPRLGLFVEVEGPGDDAVSGVLGRLGLDAADSLADGYAAMYAAAGVTEARFG